MRYRQYVMAGSVEEAWALNQKRGNRVLGGTLWIRMSRRTFDTAIDLSALGLDRIERADGLYRIGCMAPLRALETHEGLNAMTGGAVREALRGIVGVQFRNCATVGGSAFGRFGFSDVLTLLVALDAEVLLHARGRVPIREFLNLPYDRDILTHILLRDEPRRVAYAAVRMSAADLPVLNCAVSEAGGVLRATVGARPDKAREVLCPQGLGRAEFPAYVAGALDFGSNVRGSAEYRKHLCGVLVGRLMERIGDGDALPWSSGSADGIGGGNDDA